MIRTAVDKPRRGLADALHFLVGHLGALRHWDKQRRQLLPRSVGARTPGHPHGACHSSRRGRARAGARRGRRRQAHHSRSRAEFERRTSTRSISSWNKNDRLTTDKTAGCGVRVGLLVGAAGGALDAVSFGEGGVTGAMGGPGDACGLHAAGASLAGAPQAARSKNRPAVDQSRAAERPILGVIRRLGARRRGATKAQAPSRRTDWLSVGGRGRHPLQLFAETADALVFRQLLDDEAGVVGPLRVLHALRDLRARRVWRCVTALLRPRERFAIAET